MFHVDPADPTPVESQLARSVRSAVAAGLIGPEEPLPTVRQLAVSLRVNANAVERAYRELQREGLLENRPGEGYFVRGTAAAGDRSALYAELTALEDVLLREASAIGFSLDEVIIHLDSRRKA